MEWGTVSAISFIGMIFTLMISMGLPIALGIIIYKKTHAKVSSCFIGAGVFVVFALILEQIMHVIVLTINPAFQSHTVLFGLYGALAAALFEETGRFVAMKFFMKKSLDRGNALMYGVGHGGVEAILLIGLTYINNLIIAIMINTGGIQLTMDQMEPSLQEVTYQQMQAFWQTPAYHFYMAGIERMSAVVLQICLSVIIYKCVKTGQKKFYVGAFLLHFIVDFVTVITAGLGMPIWGVEIEVAVMVVVIVWGTVRIYRKDASDGENLFDSGI